MELDLPSLFGLLVQTAAHWLRPNNLTPRIWTYIRGRYWSAKIATSLCDPLHPALEKNTHHPTLQNLKLSGPFWNFRSCIGPIESRSGPESSATIVPRMFILLCSAPFPSRTSCIERYVYREDEHWDKDCNMCSQTVSS